MVDVELKELLDDANELRQFIDRSNRSNVKARLIEIVKELETQIARKRASLKPTENAASSGLRTYELKNYAWDESEKFIKFYLTVTGIEALDPANLKTEFSPRALNVKALNFNGNNYEFAMKNLLHDIKPEECSVKLKKDTILVMVKKSTATQWNYLTVTEMQIKEKQDSKMKSKPDDKADPGEGLMNIMKQMYETGDDEMKRTIAKAWTESREKQMKGDF